MSKDPSQYPDNTPGKTATTKTRKSHIELRKKLHQNYSKKLPVIVLTDKFRIKCKINLLKGERLTDFIRKEDSFIPALDAEVWSLDNHQKIIVTEFLNINKSHIQVITPDELVESKPKDFDIPDSIDRPRKS